VLLRIHRRPTIAPRALGARQLLWRGFLRFCAFRGFAQRHASAGAWLIRAFPQGSRLPICTASARRSPVAPLTKRRLTPRSSGAPTAGHQARVGGTVYIFTAPGLAPCRRRPLSSNVRPQNQLLSITMELNQVTVPAQDVEASVEFYRGLGLRLIVSAFPHYARFECPEGGSTFSLQQTTQRTAPSDVVVYFEVENLDSRVVQLQASGFVFTQEPKDESWLWREARLQDPSGNTVCLYWAGQNRRYPPWRAQE
jgi:catechol 2,3-dioxygenase-like lactoylglutathione lyase family enzyme